MQCYTELLPPTGVTDALAVPFLSSTSNNLIVAKSSLLQVFSIKAVSGTESSTVQDKSRSERVQPSKLVLIAEYPLSGTIASLGRVKILNSKSGGDAVIVAVRDAKLSLIEWDPERYGISTISIHYYESEDLQKCPWAPELSQCPSHLTVDPSSRCAALHFGVRNVAIVPFHQPGDDLVMDDYDLELDGEEPAQTNPSDANNGDIKAFQTPYGSSFVLPLVALDPGLLHPINMAFLHEYREPTFGILYSQIESSSSLLAERKDVVLYAVFTLDLEQRASTTLLSIARLPNDLYKVVPLPLPVGGALLIGANELVHVDQAGKTNAVGVNEFSRQYSTFSMADQSDMALRLEGCLIEPLGSGAGDMLIVLSCGELALLTFKLDGRSVSGLTVRRVAEENSGMIVRAGASSAASLGRGKIFLGSEEGDSLLIGWQRKGSQSKRPRLQVDQMTEDVDDLSEDEDDDDVEDDLYGTADSVPQIHRSVSIDGSLVGDYSFRAFDRLSNFGPTRDIALGRPTTAKREQDGNKTPPTADLDLLISSGAGRAGSLTILKSEIEPHILDSYDLPNANGVWSVQVRNRKSVKADLETQDEGRSQNDFDRYLVVSTTKNSGEEECIAYNLESTGLERLEETEFEPAAGSTIDIGSLAGDTLVVQVQSSEVRSYDSKLGLAQIYPMINEQTGAEPKVVSTSFADPYLLIIRDDTSALVLQADESGDLDEVEWGDGVPKEWLSGSLYDNHSGYFATPERMHDGADEGTILLFLLTSDGGLHIFALPDLNNSIFSTENVNLLPPILSANYLGRRTTARETLIEILVTDLGDTVAKSPYLILRTGNDDLILYEPYNWSDNTSSDTQDLPPASLRFLKLPMHFLAKVPAETVLDETEAGKERRNKPLRALQDLRGFSTVFLPGSSPNFVIKTSVSQPQVVSLRGETILGLSSFHNAKCHRGFTYIDASGVLRMSQLPPKTQYGVSNWASQKVDLGEDVECLTYFSRTGSYVLGTIHPADFKLPINNEGHSEWADEDITFMPQVENGCIKLLSPQTWQVIDSYPLANAERPMCIKSLNLEVSEETHERRDLIAVGTAHVRGEDIASRGSIYIFDVIEVVPEPGMPETGFKLKLIAKEEVKGAVTAMSGIGTQGFLLAAQGQKCMVRGINEDGSLPPVAFMDMQCYVSVAKELKGTGMCIMGDAVQGLWFTGYSEEPYRLTLFGKDTMNLEVVAAEFLPDDKQLYILAADGDCDLHVFQYDPEHSRSLKGNRLLHRSTFHIGHFTSSMTLLPRTATSSEIAAAASPDGMDVNGPSPQYQILITSQTGSIALITPLSEQVYRRLSALQNQLINTFEHPCGLNPRTYRAVETGGLGARGMIDGNVVLRWPELGSQRRSEIAGRVGAEMWEIRGDLEAIGGAGLGYL